MILKEGGDDLRRLDTKNDGTTDGRYKVRDEQKDTIAAQHEALNHEAYTTDGHHQEGGQGDVVGLTCTDGLYGLWQVAQHQADAGYPTDDIKKNLILHNVFSGQWLKVDANAQFQTHLAAIREMVHA